MNTNNKNKNDSNKVVNDTKFIYSQPLLILLLVVLPYSIGFFSGIKYLLPFMTAIPAGLVLIRHMKNGKPLTAVLDMILYVFLLTVFSLILMYFFHDRASTVILKGEDYWNEMMPWLEGARIAKEGNPSMFIPEHIKHTVIVAVASLVSAGMLALLFGTVLMNYMNYYVSQLMLNSSKPLLMAVVGWHPWSICRVVAFIILGCALAWPLVSRFKKAEKIDFKKFTIMIAIAIGLEILDILLKTTIGPGWRDLLVANLNESFFVIVD